MKFQNPFTRQDIRFVVGVPLAVCFATAGIGHELGQSPVLARNAGLLIATGILMNHYFEMFMAARDLPNRLRL